MHAAISQVCSLNTPFAQDLDDLAAAHCAHIEIWFTKLEEFLESHSVEDVRGLFEQTGLKPVAASFQGGLLASQGEQRREAWDLYDRRLQLCRDLEIPVYVVACDIPAPLDAATLERTKVSLRDAAERAAQHGVLIALEFQAKSAIGNNLQTAAALVAEVGHPSLGICLDAFHFYVGPSKTEDLGLIDTHNLFHVQLSDLADRPREFARDADRILPGEGDIPLQPIIEHLRRIGYQRAVSLELLNPQLWQIPTLQVGEIGITALRSLLGQTEDGSTK